MEAKLLQSLLCYYAGTAVSEHLSRQLTVDEYRRYIDLSHRVGHLSMALHDGKREGRAYVADLGNHPTRNEVVKVVAELACGPNGEVVAELFTTEPDVIWPHRGNNDTSHDIAHDRSTPADDLTLESLAKVTMLQEALMNAVPIPAEALIV